MIPFDVAAAVVMCAYDAVDHTGDLAISRVGVVTPGEIAWDECQCGQLVIAEQRRFPSRDFPTEEVDHTAECGEPWLVVDMQLSLTRCVPTMDANGNPAMIAALSESARQLSLDMTRLRRAVYCCLSALYDGNSLEAFQLGPQEVVGPSGGCGGSILQVLIGYTNDCGC